MEATALGPNKTGAALVPEEIKLMLDAVSELSPPAAISTLTLDMERQSYISQADSVGSIPEPVGRGAKAAPRKKGLDPMRAVFLDKLGERMAFERTGTRLYDALITKYLALQNDMGSAPLGESALQTLQKIRTDELAHFHLLSETIASLGGDPTAQTPCADVTAAASIGVMQVVTDPRTTFAQCLNTLLTVELTDNASWEMLSELATKMGQRDLAKLFAEPLATEAEHLTTVRGWLEALVMDEAGSPAV
ncbi:MAG TPA: ferritin-like domain-containing protein [Steroidobacteraceae bacterium]|nr:ferritin-like domain-containing protein [Steroidobacteraceae bacterium]